MKSPFMREAAPAPAQAMKSFSRDFFLSGYVETADETIVYLKNQKTGESMRLTTKGGDPEFRLVALNKDRDLASVHAVVEHGAEEAKIGYDPNAVAMPASTGQGMAAIPSPTGVAPGAPRPAGVAPGTQQPAGVAPGAQPPVGPASDPGDPPTGPYLNPAEQRLREQTTRQQSQAGPSAGASEPKPPLIGRRRRILPEPLKIEIRDP
jgi:hypothetical protein